MEVGNAEGDAGLVDEGEPGHLEQDWWRGYGLGRAQPEPQGDHDRDQE